MGLQSTMKEKPKHIDAFLYFFALTEKGHSATDAVDCTAEHAGVKPRTVWRWYKEFNWEDKADAKRLKILEEVEKQESKTLAENRANYLRILHKVLDDYIKKGFPAEIETIKDLEKVIKTCLVLQNAPSDVIKNDTVNVNVNAKSLFDEKLMKQIVEEEEESEKNETD